MTSSNGSRREMLRASQLFCLLLIISASEAAFRKTPTQYVNLGKATDFNRASVEAPPDVIEDNIEEDVSQKIPSFYRSLNTRNTRDTSAFSRGSVESGSNRGVGDVTPVRDVPLQYVGAAKAFGTLESKSIEEVYQGEGVKTYSGEKPISGNRKYQGSEDERSAVESLPQNSPNRNIHDSNYKLVCYYGGWAAYRKEPMKMDPTKVKVELCSHLIYSFAGLNNKTWEIQSLDPELDIRGGHYLVANGLKKKNPNLKVMIAIGGWNEGARRYSDMAMDPEKRAIFVDSVMAFLEEHQFDGLDLDWEYPAAWEREGRPEDKENFVKLVDELSEKFKPKGLLLSAAVSATKNKISTGYDVPALSKKLDFINVMTYDLHGFWDKSVDHHSPLFRRADEQWGSIAEFNSDFAMKYWAEQGAPKEKLILGIPFYGRSFTLDNPSNYERKSSATKPGVPGPYTDEAGFLSYYEICQQFTKDNGAKILSDSGNNVYAVRGDQWVGYDSPKAIARKMDFVRQEGYGGGMVWAVDLDDFNGICNEGKWPLLTAMNIALTGDNDALIIDTSPEPEEQEMGQETSPEMSEPSQPASPGQDSNNIPPEIDNTEVFDVFSCPQGAGTFASPSKCEEFFICDAQGVAFTQTCGNGLNFDDKLNICNWETEVDCSARRKANTYSNAAADCSSLTDGLYSNPEDCQGMFWCHNSVQFRLNCPYGQFFDPETGTCHFYAKFKCLNNKISAIDHLTSPTHTLQPYLVPHALQSYLGNTAQALAVQPYQHHSTKAAPGKNVVCYFANWSRYRPKDGLYVPENIPSDLCTHVVYAFAKLDSEDYKITLSDQKLEIAEGYFPRFVQKVKSGANNPDAILAIGGWADSAGDTFSNLVNDADKRANFIKEAIDFLQKYQFDGLSIDWQYPVCWQSRCSDGKPSDKAAYTQFLKETKEAFQPYGLKLMASISGHHAIVDNAYELDMIGQYLDVINVMTYDYFGYWDQQTGHHSPLLALEGQNPKLNADYIMQYLAGKGIPRGKLNLGVPMYGQTFELSESNSANGAPTNRGVPGAPGRLTLQAGMLAYNEICEYVKSGGWAKTPGTSNSGPHASIDNQWVGYDDAEMVQRKAGYVMANQFAGITFFTIDMDDFNNMCCKGPNPLLRAANSVLRAGQVETSDTNDCIQPPEVVTPAPVSSENWDDGSKTTTTPKPQNPGVWTTPPTTTKSTTTVTVAGTTPTTAPPKQPGQGQNQGKGCENGKNYADSSDCGKFYTCAAGERVPRECAAGLHWNAAANNCDWPDNANCKAQRNAAPKKGNDEQKMKPMQSDSSLEMNMGTCTNGGYSSVNGECNAYTVCANGQLIKKECAPGLHWMSVSNTCGPKELSNCIDTYNVRDAPCNGGKLLPDPANCNGYLQCNQDKLEARPCGRGLVWNDKLGSCDFASNVEGKCGEGSTAQPASPGQNQPSEPGPPSNSPAPAPAPAPAPIVPHHELESVTASDERISGDYMVVCYFTNWAWYRRGHGKYAPEHIDPELCTHIVYGFAVLDYSNKVLKIHDSWADIDNKFYEKVIAIKQKNPNVKVTLALGGWNDSQGPKYSQMVNNPASRQKFVAHAVEFLEKHNFDGLDLDWEYPKCWQTDCSKGPDSDKEAFSAWVKELSDALKPKGLLLSAAVSPNAKIIEVAYDVPFIAKYMDWIAVMSYDYFGHWDKATGHVSPMYHHDESSNEIFNSDYTMRFWMESGAPKNKLVMGMPLYGQAFTLKNANENGLNAPAPRKGQAGPFTRAAGFLAYYEICDMVRNKNFAVVQDEAEPKRMGPYAVKGTQWVGYDDVAMIRYKSEYIRKMGLAGGMVWALDLDDFNGVCGQGKHPLLTTIKNVLGPKIGAYPGITDGAGDDKTITTPSKDETVEQPMEETPVKEEEAQMEEEEAIKEEASPVETESEPAAESTEDSAESTEDKDASQVDASVEESNSVASGDSKYIVVCYFTNWAWYRQDAGKYVPEDIDPDLCTHVVYGFAILDGDKLQLKPHDKWADFDNKFYEKVTALKQKGKKVLLALGGWNDSAGDKYSRLVNSPSARAGFIEHVVPFLEEHNFDGLDLDWEYPKCWQVNCDKGKEGENVAFTKWVQELSAALKPKNMLLTAAVSPSKKVIDAGYEVAKIGEAMDYISVMTYDYHGQWDKKTGHVAPMFHHPLNNDETFNVDYTVKYWIEKGLDRKKLILGMPMYGQSFTLTEATDNGLQSKTYGGGEAGEFTRARGFLSYYEICHNVKTKGWKVIRDPQNRMGPYAYKGSQWVGFDDIDTIRYKSNYVKEMGLGGAMIWALDLDDFKNRCGGESYPLLKTINRQLGLLDTKPADNWELQGLFRVQEEAGVIQAELTSVPYETSCQGNGMVANVDETDALACTKFKLCLSGEYVVQSCAPGTRFDGTGCNKFLENNKCPGQANQGNDQGNQGTQGSPIEENPIGFVDENELTDIVVIEDPFSSASNPSQKPANPGVSGTAPTTAAPVETDTKAPPAAATADDTGMKVVCYFTNWAWYRPGIGKYVPEDIDPALCTHINYGFAILDPIRLEMRTHDSWADIDNEFYNKVAGLKKTNSNLKVLLALGGWNDSEGNKYSRMVKQPESRRNFIEGAVKFIKEYGFDGLDLDWEYPRCWQVDCSKGPVEDKANFAALVKELKIAFEPHGWLLSAAVSPSKKVIDEGYDVPALSKYLDIINVMTYDYHGHWDKATGHVAPMSEYPEQKYDYFNTEFTMKYWVEKGADKKKLVMGMPMYGQSFSLNDPTNTKLHSKATKGNAGPQTRAAGFLAYYEICKKIREEGYTMVPHPTGAMGPYAYKGNQWVSFDDIDIIRKKSEIVKREGYGGGMIWALDLDDFRNVCGCEEYPLLRTINRVLRNYSVPDPQCKLGSSTPYQTPANNPYSPQAYQPTFYRSNQLQPQQQQFYHQGYLQPVHQQIPYHFVPYHGGFSK